VFFDQEHGLSAAEMSSDEKNRRSHRGKALAALVQQLTQRAGQG
jgi:XTP/dITP diphosphohydrolase